MDSKRRVLIIDDDVDFADALQDTLDPARYQIETANDLQAALEIEHQFDPGVALIDVRLGQTNGLDLIKVLKEHRPDLLCVIMTAYVDVDTAIEALKSGAYDYLRKPIHPPELWVVLDRCFEKIRLETLNQLTTAALRASEERYRSIFENALEGMFRCNSHSAFTDVNPALVRILGYETVEEVLQIAIPADLYHDPDQFVEIHERFAREGMLRDAEVIWKKKDGQLITVQVAASAGRDEQGQIIYYEGSIQDITARKQAETERALLQEQLFQSQKMESIGTLAGGIAHDFNNLLTAIVGNTQLTRAELPPDHPTSLYLTDIESAATRAAALIRQLLAFSRRQRLERKAINLNELLAEFMKMLRRIIGEDIEVSLQATPQPAIVFADPVQIEQVIMNLAVNARDAMPNGGKLLFETRFTELDLQFCSEHPGARPGHYIQLAVSDTGHGIESDIHSRLFEPFFTTKDVNKGTGLGLAVAYGIINQHEGLIRVSSEVGRGAVFTIYLPVIDQPVLEPLSVTGPRLSGGNETILIAEDEPALRDLAQRVLHGLGYRVITARDGFEAIGLLRANSEQIGLAVLDLVMPRIGGYEVYQYMRQHRIDIPTLFITGYSAAIAQDMLTGADDVFILQKPYSVQELGLRIRAALDRTPTPTETNKGT